MPNVQCWFLRTGKGRSTQRKTSRNKGEKQQQTQHPDMALTPGFEPGPHCWEATALTAAPSLSPRTRKRTGKWCQEFLFLINVSASSFKWSSPIKEIEKENRRFTCCDYRKSRTTLRKDYITSDEWSFFEPARLCTPPKPLFSLKPRARCHILDERLRCSRTHHCLPPWGKFR